MANASSATEALSATAVVRVVGSSDSSTATSVDLRCGFYQRCHHVHVLVHPHSFMGEAGETSWCCLVRVLQGSGITSARAVVS